jgi:hypothetical protein
LVVVLPYVIFNLLVSGAILPNTFYAKSAEYAETITQNPFPVRWFALFLQPMIGGQILLIPGIVYAGWRAIRARDWRALVPILWIVLLPALYAWRLPVAYQHGRYEMPILPFALVFGVVGTRALFRKIPPRVVRHAWALSIAALVVVYYGIGAGQYARDVAIIDCEMVGAAKWVEANTPREAIIAAHDIGALGYFTDRAVVDLAGLVTPDVIPFIRDEARLRDFILARGASYAIFFPTWYPALARDEHFVVVHARDCPVTRAAGEADMAVYRVK